MSGEVTADGSCANSPGSPRLLFLILGPNLRGPLPKLAPMLIGALEKSGLEVMRIAWGRHSEGENLLEKVIGRLQDIARVLSELARKRPAILFVATTLDEPALVRDIPLLLLSLWSPAKKVVMMHGSKTAPFFEAGHRLYKLLTRLLIKLSDAVLLLSSEEVWKWTNFCPDGKYYRVDNPFDTTSLRELDAGVIALRKTPPFTLLFVGRLIKEKGIFELLEAMPIILGRAKCRLLIVGDGEERSAVIRQIEAADLTQSISVLGYLDFGQLSELYQLASMLILPTYREGFPSSITEAMSFGLPIVATGVGGIPDHLQAGINAMFVPVRDPKAIADAVLCLLENPDLCEKMGRANHAKVRDFAPENVIPKYLTIFRELSGLNSA